MKIDFLTIEKQLEMSNRSNSFVVDFRSNIDEFQFEKTFFRLDLTTFPVVEEVFRRNRPALVTTQKSFEKRRRRSAFL